MQDNELITSCLLSEVVQAAAMDMHEDFSTVERRYGHFGARGLNKLTNETLRSGVRRAIIPVNKEFNTGRIDCDIIEVIFVGRINDKGEKVPFHLNYKLVDTENVETFEDETNCSAKCDSCYSKQLCNDLQITETIRIINISGVDYNETKNTTILPSGELKVVTTTPFFNNVSSAVEYITSTKIVGALELESCGCIKNTTANTEVIRDCNYGCYCTYCSPCCGYHEEVGYRIFDETGVIKFDKNFRGDSFYMEWRGSVPKKNGQYLVPRVAKETLVEYIKYKEIRNKKNIPKWQRDDQLSDYVRERENMDKVRGRLSLHNIVYALTKTPIFDNR